MLSTAVMSVMEAMQATAYGHAVIRPMAIEYMMTLGTFLPRLGISSQR